ncbi:MAG: diaminopimelate decarboxylase [Actinobacteria bacterium]|nr:diaminopimelate decarboxylase [Actinomycetota bacterium]
MSAVEMRLLPRTATVNSDGALSIGGVAIADIAAQFGTPTFIYDEAHLRETCREAVAAFGEDRVIYATKAFINTAVVQLMNEEGLLLDVATGGELFVALNAGVPASRCVMHGNNKSEDELRTAMSAGLRHIVIDSFDEIERIERLHAEGLPAPRVQLRITPGLHVETHAYVSTGQDDSKFGFNLNNGDAHRAVERARSSQAMDLVGIHCHIGSNVVTVANFEDAWRVMVELFVPLSLPEITLGGGLGVAYTADDTAPTMQQWADVLKRATLALPEGIAVYVEPGRSIVASAAITVYSVGTVKPIDGIRTYVSVDGGMSDNPRPMMYGSVYEAFDPQRVTAPRTARARIVGKHCESGDILILDAPIAEGVQVGDLLATPVTGAYGYTMASNYNKVPRPAIVFVANGVARLVTRRETLDDLIRLDV